MCTSSSFPVCDGDGLGHKTTAFEGTDACAMCLLTVMPMNLRHAASHLCCVIHCPCCVACVSTTLQCLLCDCPCKHDLAMRAVVCMLLWRVYVYLARDARLHFALHEHAMSAGERLGAFRVHGLLKCVQECSSVMRAVSAAPRSCNRVHDGDNMLCPSVLRMRDECMCGCVAFAVVCMSCIGVCFGIHVTSIQAVRHAMILLLGALCLLFSYVRKHGWWGPAAWSCHCVRQQRHCW